MCSYFPLLIIFHTRHVSLNKLGLRTDEVLWLLTYFQTVEDDIL